MSSHAKSAAGFVVTLFWAIFWVLNGLDKFFNSATFFGQDYAPEFVEDFAILGLSSELAMIAFYAVSVFELVLGIAFIYLLIMQDRGGGILKLAYCGIILLFTFFTAGNILFGQGDEMLEHVTYIILAVATFELVLLPSARAKS